MGLTLTYINTDLASHVDSALVRVGKRGPALSYTRPNGCQAVRENMSRSRLESLGLLEAGSWVKDGAILERPYFRLDIPFI